MFVSDSLTLRGDLFLDTFLCFDDLMSCKKFLFVYKGRFVDLTFCLVFWKADFLGNLSRIMFCPYLGSLVVW